MARLHFGSFAEDYWMGLPHNVDLACVGRTNLSDLSVLRESLETTVSWLLFSCLMSTDLFSLSSCLSYTHTRTLSVVLQLYLYAPPRVCLEFTSRQFHEFHEWKRLLSH